MNVIDQELWEHELTEYLRHHADPPGRFNDPPPLEPPREPPAEQAPEPPAEPPAASSGSADVTMVLLWSLAVVALCIVGWSVGWYLI